MQIKYKFNSDRKRNRAVDPALSRQHSKRSYPGVRVVYDVIESERPLDLLQLSW